MSQSTHAVYEQSTGRFRILAVVDGTDEERTIHTADGYAGRGGCKNAPRCEKVQSRGPLPRGFYRVGAPRHHPRLGPLALPLHPLRVTEMYGRSGFYIHGDSAKDPGNASHGCIILPRASREAIVEFCVATLEVVPASPDGVGEANKGR